MRRLAIAVLVVAALYLALVALAYVFQRQLIYPGTWRGPKSARPDLGGYRDLAIPTADGLTGRLLYHPPAPGRPVILFFHGNGDSVLGSAVAVASLVQAGYGAVLPEYRGYAGSPGAPDEQGLYRDARAALGWMRANGIGADRTVIMGYSLGSGVAAELALEASPRALVLIAPYASMPRVAQERYPLLPARWLVIDQFDTAAKIARIGCPVLIVHGTADTTVPADQSAALKAARPDADRLLFAGVGHEVVFTPAARDAIARWLAAKGL